MVAFWVVVCKTQNSGPTQSDPIQAPSIKSNYRTCAHAPASAPPFAEFIGVDYITVTVRTRDLHHAVVLNQGTDRLVEDPLPYSPLN